MNTFEGGAGEQLLIVKHNELRKSVVDGDEQTVNVLLEAVGAECQIIVNMTPNNSNTLLFIAAQSGFENIAKQLINSGSDGRLHPDTKYSPLYAAAHNGFVSITKLILDHFPHLIQQTTVEKWSPLHAACINGQKDVLDLLITYPSYPDELYSTYFDDDSIWKWNLPFDPNAQDITGRTCLYIASILGYNSLINVLLSWRVKCKRTLSAYTENVTPNTEARTPTQKHISFGIQALMSKLNISNDGDPLVQDGNECDKCPVNVNLLCGASRETALLGAVRGNFIDVVQNLLEHNANPNIIARPVEDPNDPKCCEQIYGLSNMPITEACKQRSLKVLELLLKHGAKDEQGSALAIAVASNDEDVLNILLSKRAYQDFDYKINKKALPSPMEVNVFLPSATNISYSSMYPTVPTIIDWHNNSNVQIPYIRLEWMINSVLQLNPKLEGHPRINEISLAAITRIDFSHNNLSSLPSEIFNLVSLRYLNVAQNKLTVLPSPTNGDTQTFICPVLEELFIQDNRLVALPAEIFHLPSLTILDISNNKLQELPFEMWKAPKLRELNIAFNLLKDLPVPSTETPQNNFNKKDVHFYDNSNTEVSHRKKSRSLSYNNLIHRNVWSDSISISDDVKFNEARKYGVSQINSLNMANNLFTSIPAALACLAVSLTRLNMSYNSLRSMGYITSFPASLKQLDLSHNEISCWPSIPRITDTDPHLLCYNYTEQHYANDGEERSFVKSVSGANKAFSFRTAVMKSVCRHRRHLRLESLRTLILADNLLSRIQLSTDDVDVLNDSESSNWTAVVITKSKLIYPNISMLDISNNCLKEVPSCLYELSNLSVLNLSGNINITELPSHLGLLSRLWSLNTRGCLLQEPLKSMIESKKYKTMDIIGYLKSIYEDAQPYARMKLMIIGVESIGKTTLLDLLRQCNRSQKPLYTENHWSTRKSNQSRNMSKVMQHGENISTVGVDIGTWIWEKGHNLTASNGPIIFRTWDFGGQKEYYATHQYFLTKRSLYLVVWKITDGEKGLTDIIQWLGNIQARAPNSPVIIVGTHYDLVGKKFCPKKAEELQQIIREKFIAIPDAEKLGFPRVLDSIEVSCRTMHNIRLLANIIYDAAFMLRSPGSKTPLLLQKVPATYIALEEIINTIAINLRTRGSDPVLDAESYRKFVSNEMARHGKKQFRDISELNQATMFLHDNGVLLHYDDATLRDFYFLDPQWLCDMLAHVVTVREINPFARTGIMKLDDLNLLFRDTNDSNGATKDIKSRDYIISLLNKFEVALTWDARTLLIPSLLPENEDNGGQHGTSIKIFQRGRYRNIQLSNQNSANLNYEYVKVTPNTEKDFIKLHRILLMSYFPSGFWSRLITRLLADSQITETVKSFYEPLEVNTKFKPDDILEHDIQWSLWQTGLALYYGPILMLKIWEIPQQTKQAIHPFRNTANEFRLRIEGAWAKINLNISNILHIIFPLSNINITLNSNENSDDLQKQSVLMTMKPNMSIAARLLALIVDHIDLLLEDWYPSLGTRFVHTSEGRFLITRLVFCNECLNNLDTSPNDNENFNQHSEKSESIKEGTFHDLYVSLRGGICAKESTNQSDDTNKTSTRICYGWMIEECILSVYNQTQISCPTHSEINMTCLAPDVVFADIPDQYTINSDSIIKGTLLGRGAFGFVFKAACKIKGAVSFKAVAMKMLQPVSPGPRANESAVVAYKVALGRWDRDPLQHSCKAYCIARQELAVLLTLKHLNIVPLVGICTKPLALVLELAPLGSLDCILRKFRRSGAHIGPNTFQILVLQAARAIEYLHRRRVIYRDLKAENVLVWTFPEPDDDDNTNCNVHIKIADYGISRQTAPNGSKGFGGTEGFMAPEIIRYNGEEEYTEKVDCFSFGMFIYEIITLRQPFEGHESIKESILEGSRPTLMHRETQFPSYCLDLMVLCWNDLPKKRPSASQIVSILTAPEFIRLLDVVALPHTENVVSGIFHMTSVPEDENLEFALWLPAYNSRIDILDVNIFGQILQCSSIFCSQELTKLSKLNKGNNSFKVEASLKRSSSASYNNMLCCCYVEDSIWIGDAVGNLHAYCASNYSHMFSYMMDPAIRSPVISLLYLQNLKRVAVCLQNGRVFIVDSTKVPNNFAFAEGSFVLTEIRSGFILHSACSIIIDENCELWCGDTAGKINVFALSTTGVCGHQALCHTPEPNGVEDLKVARMCASDAYVFTSLYPGFVVYQWSAKTKQVEKKLDCSKLLPCSESIKSITIDDHVNWIKCQISALTIHKSEIYVGTTWGCLVIAELKTLRPITVFRPYENEIKYIIPVPNENIPLIATIGRRYRSLITRFMNESVNDQTYSTSSTSNLEQPKDMKKTALDVDNHVHCILWRTQNWT